MLCVWHIQKNLLAKGAKLIAEDKQRKDMLQYWMNIVKISTRSDFQASFSRWAHKYVPEFEEYASLTWLPVAEHYSYAWTCTVPHFNNRTTSQMESAHASIKSHLLGPQQTFTSAVQLISNITRSLLSISRKRSRNFNTLAASSDPALGRSQIMPSDRYSKILQKGRNWAPNCTAINNMSSQWAYLANINSWKSHNRKEQYHRTISISNGI
jgi:hypothetical protein